jgi:hypothetical protein
VLRELLQSILAISKIQIQEDFHKNWSKASQENESKFFESN